LRYGSFQNPDLTRLRTELYALKDEIQTVVMKLHEYRPSLSTSASANASDIISTFGNVFAAVSLALTNNGAEWLDWGLSDRRDGLTHAEFAALDPDSIRDFKDRIHHVCEILDIEKEPQVKGIWSSEMIRDHRKHMLMEEGQLDTLESLATVLSAVMMPDRS
jgi:hypothetical protein